MFDAILAELTAAWPRTRWDVARIEPHVTRVDAAALEGPHRTDLLWAWACIEGDGDAVAALEAGPVAAARDHLQRLGFAVAVSEDAARRGVAKLVIADGAPAGLAAYRGRGPLSAFVRTTIVRLAIDDQRRPPMMNDIGELVASTSPDPELEYMRKLYAEHLAGAVRTAWERLAAHERFLLSLRIYEAMSIEDIARVYGIHRTSAARRAAVARAALITHTRTALRERLDVGDDTLDSILRIVTTSVQLPLDQAPEPAH